VLAGCFTRVSDHATWNVDGQYLGCTENLVDLIRDFAPPTKAKHSVDDYTVAAGFCRRFIRRRSLVLAQRHEASACCCEGLRGTFVNIICSRYGVCLHPFPLHGKHRTGV